MSMQDKLDKGVKEADSIWERWRGVIKAHPLTATWISFAVGLLVSVLGVGKILTFFWNGLVG